MVGIPRPLRLCDRLPSVWRVHTLENRLPRGCAKKAGIKIPRQRMKRALLTAKERQKIPVAQMAGPVGAVVRDDGVRFESAGAAALATYGYCGSPNIVRAVRTGCKAGGHYWKRADEEDK